MISSTEQLVLECAGREGTPDSDAVKALTPAQRNHLRVKSWTKVTQIWLLFVAASQFLAQSLETCALLQHCLLSSSALKVVLTMAVCAGCGHLQQGLPSDTHSW